MEYEDVYSEEENDIEEYILNQNDRDIVKSALILLWKIVKSNLVTPKKLLTISKAINVFSNLPKVTNNINVSISLTGPERKFGNHEIYHYWVININDQEIDISSNGHFYRPETGGDSFTSMTWCAAPEYSTDFCDYIHDIKIVDDALPFDREIENIELAKESYILDVTDDAYDEDDVLDSAEYFNNLFKFEKNRNTFENISNDREGKNRGLIYFNAPKKCDMCGIDITELEFFVDGLLKNNTIWAFMCHKCFDNYGEGLGNGKGQLYHKQPDGQWYMTAGFPPFEKEDEED